MIKLSLIYCSLNWSTIPCATHAPQICQPIKFWSIFHHVMSRCVLNSNEVLYDFLLYFEKLYIDVSYFCVPFKLLKKDIVKELSKIYLAKTINGVNDS